MRRREFIALMTGAAAWPLAARAQQPVRRIGILTGAAEADPEAQGRLAALRERLNELGWTVGRNLSIESRWASADLEQIRRFAQELIALNLDLIVANATPVTAEIQRATTTIPVVFVVVSDPVGAGFVRSLARPGGNMTGFINFEDTMGGKWLQLLKEIAPAVSRAAMMFNPETAPGGGGYFLPSFEAAASTHGVQPIRAAVRSSAEIERAIVQLASEPGGGLVVMSDTFMSVNRRQVMQLSNQHKLPVIYPLGIAAREGGLLGYAADYRDLFRRSAGYVDRILRGEKPAELPVQVPTKFELVVNVKVAQAIGLTIPESFLARADEVIE